MLEWVVGLNTYLRGTLDEKISCKCLKLITRRYNFPFQLLSIVTLSKVKNT
jgi:hypothetical protein